MHSVFLTDLWWLIFAHAIGDFALQSKETGIRKGDSPVVMLVHSILSGGCVCLALLLQGNFAPWKVFWLVGTHFLTDSITWRIIHIEGKSWGRVNLIDQILHFGQIIVAMIW